MRRPRELDRGREPREALGAVVWSCVLLVGAVVFPAYAGGGGRSVGGRIVSFTSSATLIAVNGPLVLILLGIALLLSLVCYLNLRAIHGHASGWSSLVAPMCIGLVAIEALLSLPSIGLFLLPVVVLLSVGLARRRNRVSA